MPAPLQVIPQRRFSLPEPARVTPGPRAFSLWWSHRAAVGEPLVCGVLPLGPGGDHLARGLSLGADPGCDVLVPRLGSSRGATLSILPEAPATHHLAADDEDELPGAILTAGEDSLVYSALPDLFRPKEEISWNRAWQRLAPGASLARAAYFRWGLGPYLFSLELAPRWGDDPRGYPAGEEPLLAALRLAADPGTPPPWLSALASHYHLEVRARVAQNPSTPLPELASLAEELPAQVLHNPGLSMFALETLGRPEAPLSRWFDGLSARVLRRFSEVDPPPAWFLWAVTTRRRVLRFATHPLARPEYAQLAATYRYCAPALLSALAQHPEAWVREEIAKHSHTPLQTRLALEDDPALSVRRAARGHEPD